MRNSTKVSLFSPLLPLVASLTGYKRCPIKGLSAESIVIYQVLKPLHAGDGRLNLR
jgi:hypothetical protein